MKTHFRRDRQCTPWGSSGARHSNCPNTNSIQQRKLILPIIIVCRRLTTISRKTASYIDFLTFFFLLKLRLLVGARPRIKMECPKWVVAIPARGSLNQLLQFALPDQGPLRGTTHLSIPLFAIFLPLRDHTMELSNFTAIVMQLMIRQRTPTTALVSVDSYYTSFFSHVISSLVFCQVRKSFFHVFSQW